MKYTEYKNLKPLVDQKLSTRQIGKILGCSQSTIRRWLKIHNLESKHERITGEINRVCLTCEKTKKGNRRKLCKTCITAIRRIRLKLALISYLGGECKKCGLKSTSENSNLFDFHHKEDDKDFNISSTAHSRTWEELKKEADKCDLLCSNCHREEHGKKLEKRINYALKYNGYSKKDEINELLERYR